MELLEKLTNIQNELKVNKENYNSFGKYHYRSSEDILEKVKPLTLKYKTVLKITDDIILVGDRYYVKATVHLYDTEYKQSVEVSAFAREAVEKKGMDESQITGSASSYARKYALSGMFAIDDGQDADSANDGVKVEVELMTAEDKEELAKYDIKIDKLATYFKTQAENLTHSQAQQAIEAKKKAVAK